MYQKHGYDGLLIVIEGTDGAGKSTQVNLLKKYIENECYGCMLSEWKTSRLISDVINEAKERNLLNTTTFSLLYAADYADRLENVIIPALKAGFVVLLDRYVYTAFARDVARNVDSTWVRNLYSFAIEPDLTFYFDVTPKDSLDRICANREPKYYEAGMDIKLSNNPYKSYILFQNRIVEQYQSMISEFGLIKIDAMDSIHKKQKFIRKKVEELLMRNKILKND